MLSTERARLSDVSRRDAMLTDCTPDIWSRTRLYIDDLVAWRRSGIAPPPARTPEMSRARLGDLRRRLVGRE